MRQIVRDFVKFCVEHLDPQEPVYEFGSRHVPGGGANDMRPFFPDMEFVGADIALGPGVDVVLDLHNIDLDDDAVGTVLILDTLEHVEYPRHAMPEVRRILKPDGILIVTTVLNFRIHSKPDYWRFTPMGLRSLLNIFPGGFVGSVGDPRFPSTVLGVGFMVTRETLPRAEAWRAEDVWIGA